MGYICSFLNPVRSFTDLQTQHVAETKSADEFRRSTIMAFSALGFFTFNDKPTVKDVDSPSPNQPGGTQIRTNNSGNTVNGQQVIQNDQLINPNLVDDLGRTNVERMENGLAPIGPDGKPINLHHVDQTMTGPIEEMTATYHQQNYSTLHANTGQSGSLIDRTAFNIWRAEYWKGRAEDF